MMVQLDADDILEMLFSDDTRTIVSALHSLSINPTGDKRILNRLETLLEDTRIAVVQIKPTRYSELRYLVPQAIVAEWVALGKERRIILHSVISPLTDGDIYELGKQHDIGANLPSNASSIDPVYLMRLEEILQKLDEKNLIPRIGVILSTTIVKRRLGKWKNRK
ncbi:MAG: hypothetical protein AAFQ07_18135 [Chloroflexota bacterium]